MAKTIKLRTVKGTRRRGRQRKWWVGNLKDYTGLEFGEPVDRGGWKHIVETPSAVKFKGLR